MYFLKNIKAIPFYRYLFLRNKTKRFELTFIINTNFSVLLSNKRISIAGDFFNIDELEIEKQRYFGSVTYFHNGDSHTNLDLEIGETATGLYLSLVYYDTLNNQYVFSGEN